VKPEVAARLRAQMRTLPLGTTSGSRTAHTGPLTDDEVHQALKVHDNAIGILITDAEKRRRDVQIVADTGARLEAAHTELTTRDPDTGPTLAPETPSVGWRWVLGALGVGCTVAVLHLTELAALAWLFWRS
jgi:hypothetical protein